LLILLTNKALNSVYVNSINMGLREDILKNIRNFHDSAKVLYERKDYTSSCILFFKALFSIVDYILLISGKGVPKDHSERFRILQKYSDRLYIVLDKLYPIYRSTYSLSIDKGKCDEVKKYVEKLIEEYKIDS